MGVAWLTRRLTFELFHIESFVTATIDLQKKAARPALDQR